MAEATSAAPRLFTQEDLREGATIGATQGQAHYLSTVMRRAAGDPVRLFNGRDGEWSAAYAPARRDRAAFHVAGSLRPQAPEPDLWLAFAPLKRDATDLVVQKATELGASALLPVFTERTNTSRVNIERLSAIAMEAAEQSERLTVPVVREPVTLARLVADWPRGRVLAAAIERGDQTPVPLAGGLLVGPEGGFTALEQRILRGHAFVTPFWLGPLVLRAETACIAGIVLLQTRLLQPPAPP